MVRLIIVIYSNFSSKCAQVLLFYLFMFFSTTENSSEGKILQSFLSGTWIRIFKAAGSGSAVRKTAGSGSAKNHKMNADP